MAKKGSRSTPPAKRVADRSTSAGFSAIALGLLVFASSLTTVVPALAANGTGRTRSALMLVVAVCWMVAWALGVVRFRRSQLWWLAGLGTLVLSMLASSLVARFPLSQLLGGLGSGMGLVQWLALVVIAAGASSVRLEDGMRRWISLVYVWVVPVALWGVVQVLGGHPATAGQINRDLFALVMLVWAAPAVGLSASAGSKPERWGWAAAAAVISLAVLLSGARVASVALVLEAGLLLGVVGPALLSTGKSAAKWAGAALATLSGVAIVAGLGMAALGGTLGLWLAERLGATMLTRAYLYQGCIRIIAAAPVLGTGPDGYQLAAQRFVQPGLMALEHGSAITDATAADPHSSALRILAALGLVGAAALVFTLVGWGYAIASAGAADTRHRVLRDSLAIGAVGFAFASLLGPWPLTIGASPALVIGLAAAWLSASETPLEVSRVARWVVAAALSALMLFVAWCTVASFSQFTAAVASATPAERQTHLDAARDAAPWDETARFQAIWGRGLAVEEGAGDLSAFRRAVEGDSLATAYGAERAEFVRQSLTEAQRTGRTDVSWERAQLAQAEQVAASVPEVAAERLHLAVASGDKAAVRDALVAARGVAEPVAYFAQYAEQAQRMLGP